MVRQINGETMARFSPFTRAQRPAMPVFLSLRNAPFRDALTCGNAATWRYVSSNSGTIVSPLSAFGSG